MSLADTRDQRDPAAIGSIMLEERARGFKGSAVELYESCVIGAARVIPNYDPKSSTVEETIAKYTDELEQRAMLGDRYAISMLTTGQPGDSDE